MLGDLLRLHHDPGQVSVAERARVEQVPDAAWLARAGDGGRSASSFSMTWSTWSAAHAARSRGTTATPSVSATMTSPGETTTPLTAGKDDQALSGEGFGVAGGAVDDGAENALVDHDLADDLADERAAEVALAVDDEG